MYIFLTINFSSKIYKKITYRPRILARSPRRNIRSASLDFVGEKAFVLSTVDSGWEAPVSDTAILEFILVY
jgi:hypothetical protein